MSPRGTAPGPIADRTFDWGFKVATGGGLLTIGALYLFGVVPLTVMNLLFTLLLFPVYLVLVSMVMGVWLGYETDETNLKPTTEEVEMKADPWKNWPW